MALESEFIVVVGGSLEADWWHDWHHNKLISPGTRYGYAKTNALNILRGTNQIEIKTSETQPRDFTNIGGLANKKKVNLNRAKRTQKPHQEFRSKDRAAERAKIIVRRSNRLHFFAVKLNFFSRFCYLLLFTVLWGPHAHVGLYRVVLDLEIYWKWNMHNMCLQWIFSMFRFFPICGNRKRVAERLEDVHKFILKVPQVKGLLQK